MAELNPGEIFPPSGHIGAAGKSEGIGHPMVRTMTIECENQEFGQTANNFFSRIHLANHRKRWDRKARGLRYQRPPAGGPRLGRKPSGDEGRSARARNGALEISFSRKMLC